MKRTVIIIFLFSFNTLFSQQKFVTTIHPFEKILERVVGDRGEVYRILPPGASPHTYQLRPSDVRAVATARALFYGSENLDAWALKFEHDNRIELMDFIPGDSLIYFQADYEHQKSEVHQDQGDHHHSSGVDPHFWTDPLTVQSMLPDLTEKLCAFDPDGCEGYRKNSRQFSTQLDSLNLKIEKILAPFHGRNVMISHPFFQYFFKRYGIKTVSVIETSPGREPTPKKIKKLIETLKRKKVTAIFDHIQLPDRAAKIIAESTDIKVYHLDPIGGVPGRQSYSELLLYNAEIIREALR